jgi:Holliday junction resolvase RusA-like endonuclease
VTGPRQPSALFELDGPNVAVSNVAARFRALGIPTPAGSKVAFLDARNGRPRLKEQHDVAHTVWRNIVSAAAYQVAQRLDGPLDGALGLEVTFRFPMPQSRQARIRKVGLAHKISAPDTSKLVRAVEDSIEAAGLITNDARFAIVLASKVEVLDSWTGADITIRRLA